MQFFTSYFSREPKCPEFSISPVFTGLRKPSLVFFLCNRTFGCPEDIRNPCFANICQHSYRLLATHSDTTKLKLFMTVLQVWEIKNHTETPQNRTKNHQCRLMIKSRKILNNNNIISPHHPTRLLLKINNSIAQHEVFFLPYSGSTSLQGETIHNLWYVKRKNFTKAVRIVGNSQFIVFIDIQTQTCWIHFELLLRNVLTFEHRCYSIPWRKPRLRSKAKWQSMKLIRALQQTTRG